MLFKGCCRTPKHVGLGVSLHQVTHSEVVLKLVNKQDHSISSVVALFARLTHAGPKNNSMLIHVCLSPGSMGTQHVHLGTISTELLSQ